MNKPKVDASRAELRRQQILDAAGKCFRERGFHNASMHLIARTAGMSVGHIYHYFENKEAIIEAIVAADEAVTRTRFDGFRREPVVSKAMIEQADQGFDRCMDQDRSALLMEIAAESTRNARIAEIAQTTDRGVYEQLHELMLRVHEELHPGEVMPPERLRAQITLLCALFDGLRMRSLRDPGLPAEREAVLGLMQPVIARILAG